MVTLEAPAQSRGLSEPLNPLKFIVAGQAREKTIAKKRAASISGALRDPRLWQVRRRPVRQSVRSDCSINMLFDHPTTKTIRIFFLRKRRAWPRASSSRRARARGRAGVMGGDIAAFAPCAASRDPAGHRPTASRRR